MANFFLTISIGSIGNYQQYGRAGAFLSTASSMDVQGVPFFQMPECLTVRHPVSPLLE
jgi:hypothetical protein